MPKVLNPAIEPPRGGRDQQQQTGRFLAQNGASNPKAGSRLPHVRIHIYLPLFLHTTVWAVLGCVIVFSHAPELYQDLRVGGIGPIDPNRSIQTYFQGLTGIANGPQRLGDIIELLPKGKRLVIFVRDENAQSELLGMLIGYISWPHDVEIIGVTGATADKAVAAITPDSVAGIAFCSVPVPSWLGKAIRLGSGISLVPLPDAR
jgi:hypothetical protein